MHNYTLKQANRIYKGQYINKVFPSGMYEVYLKDRFYKADTLKGIKEIINNFKK